MDIQTNKHLCRQLDIQTVRLTNIYADTNKPAFLGLYRNFQRLVQMLANCDCLHPPTRACYVCGRMGTVYAYEFVYLSSKVLTQS